MSADAGWGTNLGTKAWNLDVQAYRKIAKLPQDIQDKFISDMAQNVLNKKVIENLTNKIIKQKFKIFKIEEPAITWLSPSVLKYLKENQKLQVQSPVISFESRQVKHSLSKTKTEKQKLTEKQFLQLYDVLNGNYDELFYDTEIPAIIYVKMLPNKEIIDGRDCIAIPVNINSKRTDRPINYIGTTKRIPISNIKNDKRYKKIE